MAHSTSRLTFFTYLLQCLFAKMQDKGLRLDGTLDEEAASFREVAARYGVERFSATARFWSPARRQ